MTIAGQLTIKDCVVEAQTLINHNGKKPNHNEELEPKVEDEPLNIGDGLPNNCYEVRCFTMKPFITPSTRFERWPDMS